jgi:hypothetical protein
MFAKVLCLALLLAAAPARTEPNAAQSLWEGGVTTSYVSAGELKGVGIGANALWVPGGFIAYGVTLDIARVSAGGTADNGLPFNYAIASTFAGGMIQLRLPVGPFLPHADLGLGVVQVIGLGSNNNQCQYGSGPAARLGVGLKVALAEHFALGLRGSARSPGGSLSCTAMYGPWGFEPHPLFTLGTTADYRW